jgi:hypothetical protein
MENNMGINYTFKKFCKECRKLYKPISKYNYYCPECIEKRHLEYLRNNKEKK